MTTGPNIYYSSSYNKFDNVRSQKIVPVLIQQLYCFDRQSSATTIHIVYVISFNSLRLNSLPPTNPNRSLTVQRVASAASSSFDTGIWYYTDIVNTYCENIPDTTLTENRSLAGALPVVEYHDFRSHDSRHPWGAVADVYSDFRVTIQRACFRPPSSFIPTILLSRVV